MTIGPCDRLKAKVIGPMPCPQASYLDNGTRSVVGEAPKAFDRLRRAPGCGRALYPPNNRWVSSVSGSPVNTHSEGNHSSISASVKVSYMPNSRGFVSTIIASDAHGVNGIR